MENYKRTAILREKNLYLIFVVTLFSVMGVASITPAFPSIIRHFNIASGQIGWLITAFTLPGIFLTPVMGILADRLGRKVILVPSLLLFGMAGFACVFSKDYTTLLVLRFIQGVGASALGSLNITLIGDIYSGDKRTAIMGYNASVLSIGTASFPAIGGFITAIGWQYVFILPILAIPMGIWVIYGLNNPEPEDHQKLKDYFMQVWKTINQRDVWVLFAINMLLFVVLYGAYLTYFPILLESRLNASPIQIGLVMSLMSLVTAFASSQLGKINKLIKPKIQLLYGVIMYLIAMLIMSFASIWVGILLSVIVFGIGHGILFPCIQNMLVGYTPIRERAAFMSVSSTVLRIGQTVGPLFIGGFFIIGEFKGVYLAGAMVSLAMFLGIQLFVGSANK